MQTIEVSNAAYERLLSQRNGRESISSVILREVPPYSCNAQAELESLRREKGSKLPDVKKRLGL